jgi:hypothetical protein
MHLPLNKYRNGKEFWLVKDFHSKLDAKREVRDLKNSNACFAPKKWFIFSSANPDILFSHGVYEQVIRVR